MGFANPGALLLAPLLAVLVLLYLWERRRRRLDVPSFLLWEHVPDAVIRRSRFQPDPLFFVQLAILAALMLGLADPFLASGRDSETPDRQIVVLDVSASMQTREADGTRLEQAKRGVRARLDALDAAAEVMLVSVANRPQVELAFTADRKKLAEAVDAAEALDLGTDLDGALALATRAAAASEVPVRIDLFTDIPAARLDASWLQRVNVWPTGETDDNLAVESLRVFQGSFQSPQDARAYVTVRNHAASETHGNLVISVGDRVVDRQLFTVAPGAAREFFVAGFPSGGLLRAHLERGDALSADDTAFAWIREARRLRVLLVSDQEGLAGDLRAITSAGGFADLAEQSSAEYSTTPAAADLTVFYGFVPTALPKRPCLFVFPDTAEGFLAADGEVTDAEIFEVDRSHPAVRGLQLRNAFPLRRTKLLPLPRWAEAILRTRAGGRTVPLVFAGEESGRRIAVIAFDLAAEQLLATDHESLLVLFLNLVDWLASESSPVRVIHTGDSVAGPEVSGVTEIIDPRQRAIANDRVPGLLATHAGAYSVRGASGASMVLANFSDPRESAIGREPAAPHRANTIPTRQHSTRGRHFGWALLAIAAALLLAEWPLARREI